MRRQHTVYAVDNNVIKKLQEKVSYDDDIFFVGGLWSQYKYLDQILELHSKNLYLSLITSIIPHTRSSYGVVDLFENIMKDHFFTGNMNSFLTLTNIKDMINKGFQLTGFSHYGFHTDYINTESTEKNGSYLKIMDKVYMKEDLGLNLKTLSDTFKITPKVYVYPFGERCLQLDNVLREFHIYERFVNPSVDTIIR